MPGGRVTPVRGFPPHARVVHPLETYATAVEAYTGSIAKYVALLAAVRRGTWRVALS